MIADIDSAKKSYDILIIGFYAILLLIITIFVIHLLRKRMDK